MMTTLSSFSVSSFFPSFLWESQWYYYPKELLVCGKRDTHIWGNIFQLVHHLLLLYLSWRRCFTYMIIIHKDILLRMLHLLFPFSSYSLFIFVFVRLLYSYILALFLLLLFPSFPLLHRRMINDFSVETTTTTTYFWQHMTDVTQEPILCWHSFHNKKNLA